ncbi:ankyrin [Microthyrium microscopicum]|uniref:Ankyrin n=1 Tax=Microthyrium microscopicum TaxID=703497 RepID=A0A6A6UBP4_9PEZI|nr:ankyrin [Microthyrium microscopicum]
MSSSREILLNAAETGDVEKLRDFGASEPEKLQALGLTIEDLLAAAATTNQTDVVQFCITSGAKITPQVESAASSGTGVEVYEILLPLGLPQLNESLRTSGGVVVRAVSDDDIALLTYLLENGADPDGGGRFEWMPAIAVAIEEGKDLEIIKLLARYGADVKRKGLLAMAANEDRVDVIEYLLESGASINEDVGDCVLLPHDKGSALHVAAAEDHLDVVRTLVEKGADVGLKDSEGKSALDKAKQAGHSVIVDFLEHHRAT